MKFCLWLSVWILCVTSLQAQVFKGRVYQGLAEDRGLAGVRVEVDGFSTVFTDELGKFRVTLSGMDRGALLEIDVLKPGYAVINRENLRPRLPDRDTERLPLYMCPEDQRNTLALQYYRLQVTRNIQRNYQSEAKALADALNYEAIAALTDKKKQAEAMADSLAARLAQFDPKASSEELILAMQWYQQGEVDKALSVLDPEKILSRVQAKDKAIKELKAAKQQDIAALLQAGDMALSKLRMDKAQSYYEAAAEADTSNYGYLLSLCSLLYSQEQSHALEPYAQRLLRLAQTPAQRIAALDYLASSLREQNQARKTLALYEEALELARNLESQKPGTYQSNLAALLNNQALSYQQALQFESAITCTEEALSLNRSLAKADSSYQSEIAMNLSNLTFLYIEVDRYEEALSVGTEALSIRQRLFQQDSTYFEADMASVKHNLAMAYNEHNRLEESESLYLQALEIYRKIARLNPKRYEPSLANTLTNLASVYVKRLEIKTAIPLYEESIAINQKWAEINPQRYAPEVADDLNRLGNAHGDLFQNQKALAYYLQAVAIYRKLEATEDLAFPSELAMCLNNLGSTMLDLDRKAEAKSVLLEAISINRELSQQAQERFRYSLANSLNSLGNLYAEMNRPDSSLLAYEESLGLFRQLVEENAQRYEPDLAMSFGNLGEYYVEEDDFTSAITYHKQAVAIYQSFSEKRASYKADYAASLNDLGTAYYFNDMHLEAISAFQKSIVLYRQLRQSIPDIYDADFGAVLNHHANVLCLVDEEYKAEELYLEALDIYQGLSQKDSTQLHGLGLILVNVADLYADLGMKDKALEYFEPAREVYQHLVTHHASEYRQELAEVWTAMAWVNEDALLLERAREQYQRADSLFALLPEDPEVGGRRLDLANYIETLAAVDALANAYDDKGLAFYENNQTDSARYYWDLSIATYQALLKTSQAPQVLYNASFVYAHLNIMETDPQLRYQNQKAMASLREQVFEAFPSRERVKSDLASAHYNLSWYALFVQAFEEAEASARRSLKLDPEATGVVSNLVSSLIFQGKAKKARTLIKKWKNKTWGDERYETFGEVFLADWKELEEEGITHEGLGEMRALLGAKNR